VRLCSLEIDDQFNFGDLLYRQVARLLAFKYPANVTAGQTIGFYKAASIARQAASGDIAEHILIAYLGPQTGPRVLAGQIRRGSGEAIAAVLWSSVWVDDHIGHSPSDIRSLHSVPRHNQFPSSPHGMRSLQARILQAIRR
jgi:hypothetical protein